MATNRERWKELAKEFYQAHFPKSLGELEYIDFNYPVKIVRIERGTELWGFKDPRVSPFKTTFFTAHGTPIDILGVSDTGNLRKTNHKVEKRVLNKYEVMATVPGALLSLCASGIDKWSIWGVEKPVMGGGWQFKIPEPHRYLRYTTPFPKR